MESLEPDPEKCKELDDSGCVHDDISVKMDGVSLLDLSDDVLLCILRYCSPRDLKALGYTCPRLGALVLERALWRRVRERATPTGRARLRWLLTHALGAETRVLHVVGYAREAAGCLGHVDRPRPPPPAPAAPAPAAPAPAPAPYPARHAARVHVQHHGRHTPRFTASPAWPSPPDCDAEPAAPATPAAPAAPAAPVAPATPAAPSAPAGCPGPQLTVAPSLLRALKAKCPALTELTLEYCNIDCAQTGLSLFPQSLTYLSLKGTKCYNLPMDKSFLYRIHHCLPLLETVDLSRCAWVEGSALLPLSKLPALRSLAVRRCPRLAEFVAYASLAGRYGFLALETIDATDTPLGDSEVCAFGWLPALRSLRLRAPRAPAAPAAPAAERPEHCHYSDDPPPPVAECAPWECEVPDYYQVKSPQPDNEPPTPPPADPPPQPSTVLTIRLRSDIADDEQPPTKRQKLDEQSEREDAGTSSAKEKGNAENDQSSEVEANKDVDLNRDGIDEGNPSKGSRKVVENSGDTDAGKSEKEDDNATGEKSADRDVPLASIYDDLITDAEASGSGTADTSSAEAKRTADRVNIRRVSGADEAGTSKNETQDSNATGRKRTADDGDDAEAAKRVCENGSPPDEDIYRRVQYVQFRRNQTPRIINADEAGPSNEARPPRNANIIYPPERPERPDQDNDHYQILYVNVSRQHHAVYQISDRQYQLVGNNRMRLPYVWNFFYAPSTPHVDPATLITDSAIRRFGRSDGENINFVHIGNAAGPDNGGRPSRSRLTELICRGYSGVSDASLSHLATAAPELRLVDFRGTKVTESGVTAFKCLRPDCEVLYGEDCDDV